MRRGTPIFRSFVGRLGSRARAWGAKEKGTATFSKPWTRADATSETICEPNEARKRPC